MANYCPECASALLPPGTECHSCNWNQGKAAKADGLSWPTVSGLICELSSIIGRHKLAGKLANDTDAAAHRWLDLIEKPNASEAPQKLSNEKTGRVFFRWPYAERAVYCLLKYLALPAEFQKIIIAAREDGIYWRGDDFEFFRKVIDETITMRDMGREPYMAQARQKVGAVIRCKGAAK